jgi:hypothetical protein
MPLEKWQDCDAELELWTKANGVYSNVIVRAHAPDAAGSSP